MWVIVLFRNHAINIETWNGCLGKGIISEMKMYVGSDMAKFWGTTDQTGPALRTYCNLLSLSTLIPRRMRLNLRNRHCVYFFFPVILTCFQKLSGWNGICEAFLTHPKPNFLSRLKLTARQVGLAYCHPQLIMSSRINYASYFIPMHLF